jgi:aminoglycoside phosphotransferase (APT) family kinase protein
MEAIGWLPDATEDSLRSALEVAAPELAGRSITTNPRFEQSNPLYWSASAIVDGRFVVKYAWSEVRAWRLWREGVLLQRLRVLNGAVAVPDVAVVSRRPALLITHLVDGAPMSWEWASELSTADTEQAANELATFLVWLHAVPAAAVLTDLPVVEPTPQGDTERLRQRYPRLVDERRASLVLSWCDWVDLVLGQPNPLPATIVHGDLHGYNQIWDHGVQLLAVVDFEESGIGEPEFDLRYLPGNSRSPQLTVAVMTAYERLSGHRLGIERIMAWNVRTHLGDALWRTEAGAPLPGGGTARSWVDDLATRFDQFGVTT